MLRHMHARFGTLRFARHEGYPIVSHEGVVLIDEVEAHLHPAW
jgi:AAA15 family ATPase/GTPase